MLKILRHITKPVLPCMLAMATMLSGCIADDSVCPAGENEQGPGVMLEFKMVTRNADDQRVSRGVVYPANTEQGYLAENYLDLDNMLFLLFDDQQTLLRVFRPDVTAENTSDYIKYSVRAFMFDDYFLKATGTNLTFTIVAVSNYGGLNPQNISYHSGQKLAEIFEIDKVGTFAMPISNNSTNAWIPSIYGGSYSYTYPYGDTTIDNLTPAHIPMAGMQTYTVSVADLKASTADHPLQLSPEGDNKDIYMLRALAKIEIIDRIGFANGTQQPIADRFWLEKAELKGYNSRGSIFPTIAQWNLSGHGYETQYASVPSLPRGAGYNDGLVNFFVDTPASEVAGSRVFSCYLTDYDPTSVPGNMEQAFLRLTVHTPGTSNVEEASKIYDINLAPYNNGSPEANMRIVRNNIYRYEITGVGVDLELKLVADDWTSKETEWNYNENPAMTEDGYLQWAPGTSTVINNTSARVFVTNTEITTGTFTFSQPVNGHWYAAFMAEGGTEPDAFEFIDDDGNPVQSVDGIIDGQTQATIRIRAKNSPLQSTDRSARLLFTVRTLDGRVVTADVLSGQYQSNTYFTVIQNAAL